MSRRRRNIERVLFTELKAVLQACTEAGIPILVIGGLATSAYLRRFRRFTEDIDLVARHQDVDRLLATLQLLGYGVAGTTNWWKATKQAGDCELIVDVVTQTVSESVTEQSYTLTVKPDPRVLVVTPFYEELETLASSIPAPDVEDLIILKLLSARDKDLIDLTSLLLESSQSIDRSALHRKILAASLQSTMSMAIAEWRNALKGGDLGYLWEVTYDKPLTKQQTKDLLREISMLLPE